jgi:ribosomal protein L11 methyltransferase
MNLKSWKRIHINISEDNHDFLIAYLTLAGFSGFLQEAMFLECIIHSSLWNSKKKKEVDAILRQRFDIGIQYSISTIHERNWNKAWEKSIDIVEATNNICIAPSWKSIPAKYKKKIIVTIDPKMSFGTGHHVTTRLILRLIERHIASGMHILDFGCGTGVLGIACVKLGASRVVGIDNDSWCIENAKENIILNNVQRKMKFIPGSISKIPNHKYDMIVANIDYPTISRYFKSLFRHLKSSGYILFSGILTKDFITLQNMFNDHGLTVLEHRIEDEWSACTLVRK